MKTFSGKKASQNELELLRFINYLKKERVTRYLEIGSRHGDSFHAVMSNLAPGSFGCAVDMPNGLWGRSDSIKSLNAAVNDLRKKGYSAVTVIGDSKSSAVIDNVATFAPFDAVFIDGDHTLDGVKSDFENYKDMARIIAFHDIAGRGQRERNGNTVDVPQLWDSIKDEKSIELIAPGSKMGIGIWKSPY